MSNRTAMTTAALVAALSTAALTGCTASQPVAETPAPAQHAETPRPSNASQPTPTPTPTQTRDPNACEKWSRISITGYSEGDEEPTYWAMWNGVELVDRGERPYATGKVTEGADGRLTYTVAAGDGEDGIRERLCMHVESFESYYGLGPVLYPGDVLKVPDGMEPNVAVPHTPKPAHR